MVTGYVVTQDGVRDITEQEAAEWARNAEHVTESTTA